MIFSIKIFLIH